jgi:hypothetical protein
VSVVQEYWGGVRQRLQAEVDIFSRLIRHYGEQGRENEVALSRLLGALVPQRLGLGTGMLIDSKDNYSRQIDLIVYDRAASRQFLRRPHRFSIQSKMFTPA